MSEFENHSHAQLAAMIADANPEALTDRAHFLCDIAPYFFEVGQVIATRMDNLEWQGEAADAIRAWGEHFRRESLALSTYATIIGKSMLDAGAALSEARATMPPVLSPALPTAEETTPFDQVMGETHRQDAIQALTVLSSRYRTAVESMTAAEEPRFQPVGVAEDDIMVPEGSGGSGGLPSGGGQSYGSPSAPAGAPASGNGVADAPTGSPLEYTREPEAVDPGGVGAITTPGTVAPVDSRIGTSLESVGPVPDVLAPTSPSGNPAPSAPPPAAQPTVGVPQGLPPIAPGVGRSLPGQSTTSRANPQAVGRHSVPGVSSSGPDAHPSARPTAQVVSSGAQTPLVGRPPMAGMPGAPGAMSHLPGPRGVVGGIARPAERLTRGIPQGMAIGSGAVPAVRDPVTGAVRGAGGGPVGTPTGRHVPISRAAVPTGRRRRGDRREDSDQPGKDT
ncbi:hypothetical protein [Streptomyces specialis]|uniref:hypothetical protein n=1 Tax=Streptomyces specialis TaxID=498367 RepID=UPI00073EF9E1|nr:hypothetical protein [Streptomyces specialis]